MPWAPLPWMILACDRLYSCPPSGVQAELLLRLNPRRGHGDIVTSVTAVRSMGR
jgi:hypothetical protein